MATEYGVRWVHGDTINVVYPMGEREARRIIDVTLPETKAAWEADPNVGGEFFEALGTYTLVKREDDGEWEDA